MVGISNEELAQMTVDKLWSMIRDPRVQGLTPYEAARAMGVGENTAKKVEELWGGPNPLPRS